VKTFFELEKKNENIALHKTIEKDHDRIEKRKYGIYSKIDWIKKRHPQWRMIKSVGYVESTRIIDNKETVEIRYYIVSYDNVNRFAADIRSHWGVESNVHWLLDVVFHEDQSRVKNRNAAKNLGILRRMAINKLEQDKTPKRSKRRKRLLAGWDDSYLKTLLF